MRWIYRFILTLLLLCGLLAGAWVFSNWRDDPAQPVPPELALGAAEKGSPLFFTLQGLMAPQGEQPEAAGRAAWKAMQEGPAVKPAIAADRKSTRLNSSHQ